MDVGMLFQHLGPATEKVWSPKQVFKFRTFRSPLTSDRRPMSTACGRPQGGEEVLPMLTHVDRGGDQKPDFSVDVINGWPLC